MTARDPERILVRNATRGTVLAASAEIANSSSTRRKGLLGKSAFATGGGLWIVPCGAIHTWGMKFAIDVVYLDRKRKVRKVRSAIVPWRMSACLLADSVLELPSGTIEQTHTEKGDQLDFEFLDTAG